MVGHPIQPEECAISIFHTTRDTTEVLGAYTLEGFGLGIDPVQRRLIPAIVYGASGYAGIS